VSDIPDAHGSSACAAVVDPRLGLVLHSAAGHPPPLLRDRRGARALSTGRGLLLGTDPGLPRRTGYQLLDGPGDLVLYTDGVVERRGQDLDEGVLALVSALAQPEAVADMLVASVPGGGEDDAAVIAVALDAVEADCWELPARLDSLRAARSHVAAHCAQRSLAASSCDRLVLACSEAVANAVEHSGAQRVRLRLWTGAGLTRALVADDGSWRPPTAGTDRGRGRGVIRQLADDVIEAATDDGTVVLMSFSHTGRDR
jgi:anti-sigma regulatory factor (Ser/Thr protein kinase)